MLGDGRARGSMRSVGLGIIVLLIALAPIVSGLGAVGMIDRASAQDDPTFDGHIDLSASSGTDGTQWSYQIADLDAVDNLSAEITGDRVTESQSSSGTLSTGESFSVSPSGNAPPEDAEIEIEGMRDQTDRSESVADGSSIDVGGNVAPESESITIEGSGSTSSESASGLSDGSSISVGGSIAPSGESITVIGDETTSSGSDSMTISEGGSDSLSIGGNRQTDLTLSADPAVSDSTNSNPPTLDDLNNGGETSSFSMDVSDIDTIGEIEWRYRSYSSNGYWFELGDQYIKIDGERAFTASDPHTHDTYGSNFGTFTFDTSVDVSSKDTVDVIIGNVDHSNSDSYYESEYLTLKPSTDIDASATVGGSSVNIPYSGSTSVSVSPGSTSISIDDGHGSSDISASWTERTTTKDPSVSIDGSTASQSGFLEDGESITQSVDLSTGTHSVGISSGGPSPSVSASWTEDHRAHDPSVTIDGSTVSHNGALGSGETASGTVDLSTGSHTVDVSSTGSLGGASASWTEIDQSEDVALDVGGTTVYHDGLLGQGETVSEPIDLSETSSTTIERTGGEHTAGVSASWTEIAQTQNPSITINGETVSHSGTVAPGETVDLSADLSESWIIEGSNSVELSMDGSNGGPSPQAGAQISHDAATIAEISRTSNTWEEEADIYRQFSSDQDAVTSEIPLPSNVVEIDQVAIDGSTVSSDRYQLDGTDLSVDVGSVSQGEEISIFARGSKVRVQGGEIDVTTPTNEGDSLNTSIAISSIGPDNDLRVDVGPTVRSERIHRAEETSWGSEIPVRVSGDGSQELLLSESGATEGGSATIQESQWDVEIGTGDVDVIPLPGETPVRDVDQDAPNPRIDVSSGAIEGDSAEITYHDAQSGEEYQLRDTIDDRVVQRSQANSPVTFGITDQDAEYVVELAPLSSDALAVGGAGGASGDGLLPPWLLLLLSVGGAIGFLGLSSQRGFISRSTVLLGAGGVVILGLEVASPVSVIAELRWGLVGVTSSIIGAVASTGLGVALGAVGILIGIWIIDGRTERSLPVPLYLGAGALSAFWLIESLAPGAITNGELPGIAEIAPLIWISLIGGTGLLLWRWLGSRSPTIEIAGETVEEGSE